MIMPESVWHAGVTVSLLRTESTDGLIILLLSLLHALQFTKSIKNVVPQQTYNLDCKNLCS